MFTIKKVALFSATTLIGGSGAAVYFASINKDKTIENSLRKRGINLIKSNEEYQISFMELRKDEEFISEIRTLDSNLEKNSSLKDGTKNLEKWCNKILKSSSKDNNSKELSKKAEKYCVALPITAKAKLLKNKYTPVTDWNEKFDSIKYDSDGTIALDLSELNGSIKNLNLEDKKMIVIGALQEWCKKNEDTKLNSIGGLDIYKKVGDRCFNEVNQK